MADEHQDIFIDRDGEASHLHDDTLTRMTSELGEQEINRASHLETWNSLSDEAKTWLRENYNADRTALDRVDKNLWWADLLPSEGPVLGPFLDRSDAAKAEEKWLNENKFGGGMGYVNPNDTGNALLGDDAPTYSPGQGMSPLDDGEDDRQIDM
jgi:hypothetical protein